MDEYAYTRRYCGPVKALAIDWAGTMIDHGSCAPAAVFVDVFKQQGISISLDQAREPMGRSKRDHIEAIATMPAVMDSWESAHGHPPEPTDIDALYGAFLPQQMQCIDAYSKVIDGVVETVQSCRHRHIQIGSTTGYTSDIMEHVLGVARRQGLEVDCLVTASEIDEGRPAPWMIFEVARRLGVYPMESIVTVDDTALGIEAGLNAGTWTVAIARTGNEVGLSLEAYETLPRSQQQQHLRTAYNMFQRIGAHYVIDSVADLLEIIDDIEDRLRRGERP